MANTPQAKRIRRNATRTVINHSRISRIRTFIKAVETALAAGKRRTPPKRSRRCSRRSRAVSRAGLSTRTRLPGKFPAFQSGLRRSAKKQLGTSLKRAAGRPAARLV